MSDLPTLTPAQVVELIPNACNIEPVDAGGQKVVFKGTIEGSQYALKFAKVPVLPEDLENEDFPMSDVAVRAKREVEIIRDCKSPYMVKLGPIGLQFVTINNQAVLFFSEEYVCGHNLSEVLQHDGRFLPVEVAKLGLHVTDAIQALWELDALIAWEDDVEWLVPAKKWETPEFQLCAANLAEYFDRIFPPKRKAPARGIQYLQIVQGLPERNAGRSVRRHGSVQCHFDETVLVGDYEFSEIKP